MKQLLIALLFALTLPALAHDKPKPAPKPEPAPAANHKGACEGLGRFVLCTGSAGGLLYLGARAAGWKGFAVESQDGKKRAEAGVPIESPSGRTVWGARVSVDIN